MKARAFLFLPRIKRIAPPLSSSHYLPMKSFLKSFFASYLGSCLGIATLAIFPVLILCVIVSLAIFETASRKSVPVQKGTFLVIDISRGFSDHPTFSAYNRNDTVLLQGRGSYGLLDTLLAVSEAKNDSNISGILLSGTACYAGIPTLEELRKSLTDFRKSGKPVFAYLPTPTLNDYFLASAASKVWIHPLSELPLNGLCSEGIYLKKALEKIGIGIQIVKVGKFKTAVEPLVAETMSAEDRSQREAILHTQWNKIIEGIARSRNLSPERINEISRREGLIDAPTAIAQHFVDASCYKDEMIDLVTSAGDFDCLVGSFRQIDLADYLEQTKIVSTPELNAAPENLENQIAVVYAEGEIVDGYGDISEVGGERLAEIIRGLRGDGNVRAIVLRVNSPGGSVFASEQIRRELKLAAQNIPVVVSMGDVAASGGYWISTPAQRIFVDDTTITGSIGVFGVLPNFESLGNKIGISTASVTNTELAELGTLRRPQTPRELAVFQKSVDKIYERFTTLVAESRKLPQEKVKAIAEGRVWDGLAAKRLGLADEIGGLSAAINYTRKILNLPHVNLQQYPGPVNPYQEIADAITDSGSTPVILANQMLGIKNSPAGTLSREFTELWKKLRALNDPNCVYARLPWDFPTDDR